MRHRSNIPALRALLSACAVAACAIASAQQEQVAADQKLTLPEALQLAQQRNGTVKAALLDVKAANARVDQSRAAYFPIITPSYRFQTSRTQVRQFGSTGVTGQSGSQTAINTSLRLLDAGERQWTLLSSRAGYNAQRYSTANTLRGVLFDVHQQYFDALRAQELLRVADSQVQRAQTILESTKFQVEVGQAAGKDVLQVEADLANAKVQQLQARNQVATSLAILKATIGWDSTAPLPELVSFPKPSDFPTPGDLQSVIGQGMTHRPDLLARRQNLRAEHFNVLRTDRDASVSFSVDLTYDQALTPNSLYDRALVLNFSLPFLDGGRARAAAREQRLNYEADMRDLQQAEREARSEIESAYTEVVQNAERVQAAQAALTAAQKNYEAAEGSQRAGAGNIIDVLTAQVSLVTAESNAIQANYDYYISAVRLKLVTGEPIPGEAT